MEAKKDFIASVVIRYFQETESQAVQLDSPPELLEMPWSAVYFINLKIADELHKVVVKISRFPEQQRAEESWEEHHLIDRSIREYDSLVRIYEHFQANGNPSLQTVHPIAFLREINGILMKFFDGNTFYQSCVHPRNLLTERDKQRSLSLATRAGEWLRIFHDLSASMQDIPCDRLYHPQDAFTSIQTATNQLKKYGITLKIDQSHPQIWSILEQVRNEERVWMHSDFHMGNVMVVGGDAILGFDTALDKKDHPFADVGKFCADLQTRGIRILSYGLLPSNKFVLHLRQQFLDAYLQDKDFDNMLLGLYEGQFLLEKWLEMLESLDEKTGIPAPAKSLLTTLVINPMFQRITTQWAERIIGQQK